MEELEHRGEETGQGEPHNLAAADGPAVAEPATEPPPASPPSERSPFWGYSDLFLFAGIAVPSMLLGWGIIQALVVLLRIEVTVAAAELILVQFLGYLFLFGGLALIFRVQYGKPFWRSLGWVPIGLPPIRIVLAGLAAAFAVAVSSVLIRLPNTPNPMTELMRERSAVIVLTLFGTTVGPLCEELAFRGFLQPLLVRTFGTVAGILLAALPFGLMHFQEYGYSWKHAALISLAGAAFGVMRHATGSTKAATLMHASYNALFFAATFGRTLPPK